MVHDELLVIGFKHGDDAVDKRKLLPIRETRDQEEHIVLGETVSLGVALLNCDYSFVVLPRLKIDEHLLEAITRFI